MSTKFLEFYLLAISQPYDFEAVLAFLKRHAAFGIEEVIDTNYVRYLPYSDKYGMLEVELEDESQLRVTISSWQNHEDILDKIKQLFDTEHEPTDLAVKTGVRVVGSYDPFETSISIILGQLVSIKQANYRLEQLIKLYGKQLDEQIYAFPSPKDLAQKELEEIAIPKTKAGAIRLLSQKILAKELVFSQNADVKKTEEVLLSIKGIGPWTSQLILMRCFGYKDAFPKNDLFIRKAIADGLVDESLWPNQRAYLTHYLWNQATKEL